MNAIKVLSASSVVLFAPGLLLVLVGRLPSTPTFLEAVVYGGAVSFGLAALLTVVCMLSHIPLTVAAVAIVIGTALLAVVALQPARAGRLTPLHLPVSERLLGVGLFALGVLLFLQGSPLSTTEDQIHVAVVRRLAALARPSVFNIYMTPDLVYTYPFPTTHVAIALTSLVGGIDVLLVYHKLRYAWAILAVLCVYVTALKLFENHRLAAICAWTGIVFVLTGVFGHVPPLMWAQLAPFSHPSDVALGVLLPLLIATALAYLSTEDKRARVIFLVMTLLMVLAQTTGKTREIIQFTVYLGSFALVALLPGAPRGLLPRIVLLLAATLALVGGYVLYHRLMVGNVNAIVDVNRQHLLDMWTQLSPADYVRRPLNDGRFVNNFDLLYTNANALMLMAAPVLCAAFGQRQLLGFMWAGLFAYLLIIRIPIVSVAYLLATYFDMLSTPVRNVIFFVYVIAGALVYLAAALAARLRPLPAGLLLLAALAFAAARAAEQLKQSLPAYPDVLFMSVLTGFPVAVWFASTKWGRKFRDQCGRPTHGARLAVSAAVFMVALGVCFYRPASALTVWKTAPISDLRTAIGSAGAPVLPVDYPIGAAKSFKSRGTNDVPTPQLVHWMQGSVPAEAVCAVNLENANILTTFFPQQVPAWPLAFHDPINYCRNFPKYCDAVNVAANKYAVQPFFNDRENRAERIRFLTAFNVSYVIVDPSSGATMTPVLDQYPDLFTEVYSEYGWRVFKVAL